MTAGGAIPREIALLFEGAPTVPRSRLDAAGPFVDDHGPPFGATRASPTRCRSPSRSTHRRAPAARGATRECRRWLHGTGYDRGTGTPLDVAGELERLNDAYEAHHGFRYCVFVAGRSREALLPGLAAALDADRDAEIHQALDAIVDIAMTAMRSCRHPDRTCRQPLWQGRHPHRPGRP